MSEEKCFSVSDTLLLCGELSDGAAELELSCEWPRVRANTCHHSNSKPTAGCCCFYNPKKDQSCSVSKPGERPYPLYLHACPWLLYSIKIYDFERLIGINYVTTPPRPNTSLETIIEPDGECSVFLSFFLSFLLFFFSWFTSCACVGVVGSGQLS